MLELRIPHGNRVLSSAGCPPTEWAGELPRAACGLTGTRVWHGSMGGQAARWLSGIVGGGGGGGGTNTNGVAGGAGVEHEVAKSAAIRDELDDPSFFFVCGHAQRDVNFAAVVVAEPADHRGVAVARRWNLDHRRVQAGNLFGGCQIPDRGRVDEVRLFAPLQQLAVLIEIEFEKLAMFAIAFAIAVHWIGMRAIKLLGREHLADSPFLGDHVVNSKAVLPMVTAMSWMTSACEGIHRGYRYFGFDNYRVLKGIVFDETLANEYTLELKEVSKGADEILMDAMIRSQSPEGKPRFHYSAQITLRAEVPDAPILATSVLQTPAGGTFGSQFYNDGTLFHGYSFQGVDQLLDINESGLVMRCVLPHVEDDYQGQFPIQAFNYFMADIGLQSIGIWSRNVYKMGSLPLRAGKGRQYRQGVFGQIFFVTMKVRSHSETNVTASITLHDEDGRIYLVIEDLEVTMSLRLNELFLKNQLVEATHE